MELNETTISSERMYNGKIINLDRLTVKLPDGSTATREVIRHPGAALIVPITDDGYVIMVRQFRKPVEKACLEMPAGKLDAGEEPLRCAERELEEETGYKAEKIEYILTIDTTPGFSDEKIHIYVASGLKPGRFMPDSDEFLEVEKVKIDELIKMIYEGKINDAKTIIGAFIAQGRVNK